MPGTIVEAYIRIFGGRIGAASIVAGVVLFLAGWAIAGLIDFATQYRETHAVYLGAFGVAWAMWWVAWGTRRVHLVAERIQPIFLVPPERFQTEIARFERWTFNWRWQAWISVVLWILSCYDIYRRSRSGDLAAMPPIWSTVDDSLLAKNLILFLYDLPIVVLFVTSGMCIIGFVRFVWAVSKLPLLPYLALAQVKLRDVMNFSVAIGLAWSIGVCLVVVLFRLEFRLNAVVSVLVYTAFGLAILLVPEATVHGALERVRHDVLNEAIQRLKIPGSRGESPWLTFIDRSPDPQQSFDRAVQEALNAGTWTYDLSSVSSVLGTWLLPLVPLLVNSFVYVRQ